MIDERQQDSDSKEMEIDNNETVRLDLFSCGPVYEVLIPYPTDPDKLYLWNARAKKPVEVPFSGEGSGFNPGINPGPYEIYLEQGSYVRVRYAVSYDVTSR